MASAIVLGSCSNATPEILEQFWELSLIKEDEVPFPYERLTFYIHVADDDGVEDLEYVYLVHDDEELFWQFGPDTWDKRHLGEEMWLGSNSILMPDRSPLPRGAYRIILLDKAGERTEETLYLSTKRIRPSDFTFPVVTVKNGEVSIVSPYREHTLRFYSGDDKLLSSLQISALNAALEEVLPEADRRKSLDSLWIYVYDDSGGFSLLTGPFPAE